MANSELMGTCGLQAAAEALIAGSKQAACAAISQFITAVKLAQSFLLGSMQKAQARRRRDADQIVIGC